MPEEVRLDAPPGIEGGFTQVPNWILRHPDLSMGDKLVYAALLSYAWDAKLRETYKGQRCIADDLGCGLATVKRSMARLRDAGLLTSERRGLGLTSLTVLRWAPPVGRKRADRGPEMSRPSAHPRADRGITSEPTVGAPVSRPLEDAVEEDEVREDAVRNPPTPRAGGARVPTVPLVMEMTTEEVFDAVPLDIPPLDAKPARNGAGLAAQVAQVYEHWRTRHPQAAPRLPMTAPEARKATEAMRRGHTVASLSESIDGYHADPWHRGANDRGTAYLDLALILRDESHIAKGIEMARNPRQGRPVHGPTAGNAAVLAAFVRDEQARAKETQR